MLLDGVLCFDVENTTYKRPDGTRDYTPFHPNNRLVSIGWGWINNGQYTPSGYEFFYHKVTPPEPSKIILAQETFQKALDEAKLVVGWNLKFDLSWIRSCGFTYNGPLWDAMCAEYILHRGQKGKSLTLEDTAERRNVFRKKGDLVRKYLDEDIQFDELPMAVTKEYGEADVRSTAECYLSLVDEYENEAKGMVNICTLAMDFCDALTDIECNGIKIDSAALDAVEVEYKAERIVLQKRLQEITHEVMGDTVINLSSPEQLSQVIYSRKVKDKEAWKRTFNIGLDERKKPLRRPKMSPAEFGKAVKANCETLKKTTAVQCSECLGTGKVFKVKKNGDNFKKQTQCLNCQGMGYLYHNTSHWAGFKFSPRDVNDCSVGGFATDKDTLKILKMKAEVSDKWDAKLAVEFLEKVIKLNAIDTYIDSFIGGIKRGLLDDGTIHPSFNQCVTATGRLSSSNPNFQNMPREGTFPIKKVVVSRFEGGEIWECDYAALEFRVAGFLADDPVIKAMVKNKEDAHKKTATIIHKIGVKEVTKDQRQAAKEHTFAPLYGAMGFGLPDHVARYYQEFTKTYPGVGSWHKRLQDEAINTKKLVMPDGKVFAFPFAQRTKTGSSTSATQIKNYPVQYLATGMIVPLALVRLKRLLKQYSMKSIMIVTVHDSLVLDVSPQDDRIQLVKLIVAACDVVEEVKARFGFTLTVPLEIELAGGPNWMEKKIIPHHDIDIQDILPF